MKPYHEHIDKMLIEILYNHGKVSSGELKKLLDQCLLNHGYNKTAPDTYWARLRQLTSLYSNRDSKYVIQPVLQKIDEGRGKKVFYFLTEDAKIRCELKLPIMNVEESVEKAYRLLFYYIIFFYNPTRKLKDENNYNVFLDKLRISKNELEYQGRNIVKDKDSKENIESTHWIHGQSEIRFIQNHYLEGSENEGKYEYFYMLPGISPSEFKTIKQPGLVYQKLNFKKDDIIQYFKLLEKLNLIKKLQSYPLIILNEERYIIVDDSLKDILLECWTLQSHIFWYLVYRWQGIRRPKDEEIIWYKHFYGETRSEEWFLHCNHIRTKYMKYSTQEEKKQTQERLHWEKLEIIKKFELIKKEYAKTIYDYSYFIDPLLNVVYPIFLRKEFKQLQ